MIDFNSFLQLYLMDIFRQGNFNIMMIFGLLTIHILFNNHSTILAYIRNFYIRPTNNKLTIEANYLLTWDGYRTVGISEAYRAMNWKLTEHSSFSKNLSSISRPNDLIHLPNKLVPLRIAPTNGIVRYQDDIWAEFSETVEHPGEKSHASHELHTFQFALYSSKTDLGRFIDDTVREYRVAQSNENYGQLYHFIYTGKQEGQLRFNKSVLSSSELPSHETFDNLSHEHVDMIKQDLDGLKNAEYYKRTGLRRKKSYLFWGDPGCGKTSTVMAMALYDKRHIIEINFDHIKGDDEFQELMNVSSIEDVTFTKANIILFFEEIAIKDKKDLTAMKSFETKNEAGVAGQATPVPSKESKEDEKWEKMLKDYSGPTITSVLSRLDGVGNYNGLVIVAATNNKENLDKVHPAICRDQRLTPVHFTFSRKEDIISMTEHFYETPLTQSEIITIPDQNAHLSGATIRTMLDRNKNSRSKFLKELSLLAK
jgi:uncharacterized protein YrzB (UPF0473 family)